MSDTCSKCKFYRSGAGGRGLCHLNPPRPFLVGVKPDGPLAVMLRPDVAGNDLACSHFIERLVHTATDLDRRQLKV
jgi:hypothetical protein